MIAQLARSVKRGEQTRDVMSDNSYRPSTTDHISLTTGWQTSTIETITQLLQADEEVRALIVFGSAARSAGTRDVYSDVDLLLVVAENALTRFFPATDWLGALGNVFTYEQSSGLGRGVTRVCFNDFRRVDFVIATEAAFARDDDWPLSAGWRVLFSRTSLVDNGLERMFRPPTPSNFSSNDLASMANHFWFKATLALSKVMHDDVLIALHLALDLVRDCCVLGMLLRDRAEGTTHHRTGGQGNDVVARLAAANQPYNASGILNSIAASAAAFDTLALEWDSSYRSRSQHVLDWVAEALVRLYHFT